eukprot:706285-Pyramimonas_sp.AAC.1
MSASLDVGLEPPTPQGSMMNAPTSTLQARQQTDQRTGSSNIDSSSRSGQGAISSGPWPGPVV